MFDEDRDTCLGADPSREGAAGYGYELAALCCTPTAALTKPFLGAVGLLRTGDVVCAAGHGRGHTLAQRSAWIAHVVTRAAHKLPVRHGGAARFRRVALPPRRAGVMTRLLRVNGGAATEYPISS